MDLSKRKGGGQAQRSRSKVVVENSALLTEHLTLAHSLHTGLTIILIITYMYTKISRFEATRPGRSYQCGALDEDPEWPLIDAEFFMMILSHRSPTPTITSCLLLRVRTPRVHIKSVVGLVLLIDLYPSVTLCRSAP